MDTVNVRDKVPVIAAPHAYALLLKEFARLKAPECTHCRMPLPFWGPAPAGDEGYWYMPTPQACAHGCGKVVLELWARFTTDHRIAPPQKQPVAWMRGVRRTAPQH